MSQATTLGQRVRELRKSRGEIQAVVAEAVGIERSSLSSIELGRDQPGRATLAAIAQYFGVTTDYLQTGAGGLTTHGTISLATVFVRGAVQAGVWSPATEWDADDWYPITAPQDPRYPGVPRFGLEVRGNSMNLVYPAGTVVIAVRFFEIEEEPRDRQHVVVVQRNAQGEFEATLKQFRVDDHGRRVLWPRSDDPEFHTPIILPPAPAGLHERQNGLNSPHFGTDASHDAGVADIAITALVIGSYRPE